jgi:predicted metal-dependent HD superfamily phosphohydrolase
MSQIQEKDTSSGQTPAQIISIKRAQENAEKLNKKKDFNSAIDSILKNSSLRSIIFDEDLVEQINASKGKQLKLPFIINNQEVVSNVSGCGQNSKGKDNEIKITIASGINGSYLKIFGEIYKDDLNRINKFFNNRLEYEELESKPKQLRALAMLYYKEMGLDFNQETSKMINYLIDKWDYCFRDKSEEETVKAFQNIISRYTEDHRYYHTIKHIYDIHCKFDELIMSGNKVSEETKLIVRLALFYHDFIYEIGNLDNEKLSADLAVKELTEVKFMESIINQVKECILVTCYQLNPEPGGIEQKLIVDCDLSGFALPWKSFIKQRNDVIKELGGDEPGREFYIKQINFLSGLVVKPNIFYTDYFKENYEHFARANIKKEIERIENIIENLEPNEK